MSRQRHHDGPMGFGPNEAQGSNNLFFFGPDADGKWWYGWAQAGGRCKAGTYDLRSGAYREGATFHLSSGVVLDLSAGLAPPDPASPNWLSSNGSLCVDAHGVVVGTAEEHGGG